MQLQVKTILNAIQHFPGFVYRRHPAPGRQRNGQPPHGGHLVPHAWHRPAKCSRCRRPAPGYDRCRSGRGCLCRLWGMVTWFVYAARRVHCPEHGVVVEHVPWSEGKRPVTIAMMCFLVALGAAVVVAGDGAGLWHQLGMRLSLGGMVCGLGLGAPEAGKRPFHRGGRDSLGPEQRRR